MKKQDKGFTLIELLIVIVILGILATVVVFAVSGIRDQGDQSACETEGRALQTALEAFYADSADGSYPTQLSDLDEYFNTDFQYFTTADMLALTTDTPPALSTTCAGLI